MHNIPILLAANSPPPESLEATAQAEAPVLPFAEVFEAIEEMLEDLEPEQLLSGIAVDPGCMPQEPVEVIIDPETGKRIPVEPATPWQFDPRLVLTQLPEGPTQLTEMAPELQAQGANPGQTQTEVAIDNPLQSSEVDFQPELQKLEAAKPLGETPTPAAVELEWVQANEGEKTLTVESIEDTPVPELDEPVQATETKGPQVSIEVEGEEVAADVKAVAKDNVEAKVDLEPEVNGIASTPQTQVTKSFQAGELARTAEARPVRILEQISSTLETLVDRGQTSLRLQLHPEHLGRIDLKLNSGNDGVQVWITPDASSTSQLLQAEVQQLKQSMQEAGVTLTDVNIGPGSQQREAPKPFDLHGQRELHLDDETQPEIQTRNRPHDWQVSGSTREYLI
ncbi:MAG: flagellar hook-length control protein FliK [Chloroflexi bacterium]|nr:MAG: flagellar hook-length control protein FliK [Chloroflexota bacterium]MBL1194836.1 flagellar hook-length control protein FliK [Chloroflexota bacterium]NOH12127.1 hypothetical protein [Chloroflexota bacterium]